MRWLARHRAERRPEKVTSSETIFERRTTLIMFEKECLKIRDDMQHDLQNSLRLMLGRPRDERITVLSCAVCGDRLSTDEVPRAVTWTDPVYRSVRLNVLETQIQHHKRYVDFVYKHKSCERAAPVEGWKD